MGSKPNYGNDVPSRGETPSLCLGVSNSRKCRWCSAFSCFFSADDFLWSENVRLLLSLSGVSFPMNSSYYPRICGSFSHGFPNFSSCFVHGFPIGFPMIFLWFSMVFPMGFPNFPMVFLWFFPCFPIVKAEIFSPWPRWRPGGLAEAAAIHRKFSRWIYRWI